jgi:hypothetical protein
MEYDDDDILKGVTVLVGIDAGADSGRCRTKDSEEAQAYVDEATGRGPGGGPGRPPFWRTLKKSCNLRGLGSVTLKILNTQP